MSSSSGPPRSRLRFGFKGKRPGRNPQAATADEMLDSLTRQARLLEKGGEERTLGLETILEIDDNEQLPSLPGLKSGTTFERFKTRNLGRTAFAAMLIGGLAFLWIFSRLSRTLSLQSLATLQQTISRVGFEDWQKVALMALSAFSIAVIARHSRNNVTSRLSSTV
ncbi:MAG: hypothetical protein AUI95_03655 [Crenarchaeota archaeon 13_1_40CM_3_52_4]|nr:MAG: hypothetical protein AUI95_03655 [Crenarchaeota archaeon 13_1_40CM_3_52_4]